MSVGPANAPGRELEGLDLLRIIASLGVVFYHYGDYLSPGFWPAWIALPIIPFRLWVDLFFVLSGFVISYVYAPRIGHGFGYGRFLQKRLARLMPLHVATLLFYVALGLATLHGVKANSMDRFDWSCLVPNLLLLHAMGICHAVSFNTPSWSISAEMGMYICFPLFAMLGKPARGAILWVAIIAAIVILEMVSRVPGQQYWLFRASQGGMLRAVPSFMLGVVLHRNRDLLALIPFARLLAPAALALFIGLSFTTVPYQALYALVCVCVVLVIAVDVRGGVGPTLGAFSQLGDLTYSVYLLHLPVASVMMTIAKRLIHLHGVVLDFWVLLTFTLTMVISMLSYRYFEMPLRSSISRLGTDYRASPGNRPV